MNKDFALSGKNLLWIGIGFLIVVIGFVLMMGAPSTEEAYNPDIFSTRRIVIAPTLAFIGCVVVMFGILVRKPSQANSEKDNSKA
jgi:uncharacterized membrane protein